MIRSASGFRIEWPGIASADMRPSPARGIEYRRAGSERMVTIGTGPNRRSPAGCSKPVGFQNSPACQVLMRLP
jgi:hypothetical protein